MLETTDHHREFEHIVSAHGLSKVYNNKFVAVDNVSFDAEEGQIVGLLGPNGAGKTTTVRMLTTLSKPTSGSATVGGYDVVREPNKVRELVGIVPQDLSVDDDLTGMENLILQSRLYHVPGTEARRRALSLLELMNLEQVGEQDVETYSGGMRKRLEIICGLISNPRVLFLDEPTLGLDVQSRMDIWKYIRRINQESKMTLFLTTHYMEEADSLCDKIVIMDHGKVVASGSPKFLKSQMSNNQYEILFRIGSAAPPTILQSSGFATRIEPLDGELYRAELTCNEDELQSLIMKLESEETKIIRLTTRDYSLDEVFLHYTGTMVREDGEGEQAVQRFLKNKQIQRG